MSRSTTLPQRQVIAAKGLMFAADGVATIEVARRLGVSPDRVRRWRSGFEAQGVAGVGQIGPGRGRKPSLPEGKVAEIVRMTLEERPDDGSTHWSTRTLAPVVGVSRETVRRVWADHGLRPWRAETFKLSNDRGRGLRLDAMVTIPCVLYAASGMVNPGCRLAQSLSREPVGKAARGRRVARGGGSRCRPMLNTGTRRSRAPDTRRIIAGAGRAIAMGGDR